MNLGPIFSNGWMTKLITLLTPTIKTKIQTKVLQASISGTGVESDLSFNNLVVGKWYGISGRIYLAGSGSINIAYQFEDGASFTEAYPNKDVSGQEEWMRTHNLKFQAQTAVMNFNVLGFTTGSMIGDGTRNRSYLQIEELPNHEETTDFS